MKVEYRQNNLYESKHIVSLLRSLILFYFILFYFILFIYSFIYLFLIAVMNNDKTFMSILIIFFI